ncbi:ATP-binding protein [Actinomadura opuntiae]|uniref:ATP-binding protein n=1 Tax=Actinomadura sp. OS1-43 TaxID=604315 RepID=UPI00255A89BA|nr:BTAD domain-containing putative transcriptional regulator [Actinomadura sp. OS1-43]MDL4821280.1 BTAD domain-containing putative transcriptional regulator [Actinomadura sp. OS1-43]
MRTARVKVELALLSRVSCRGRDVTSPRLRDLLALLAAEPRTGLGVNRLVEGLWPDGRPENPGKALQVVVSRARSQLGPDVIASTPSGYRLGLDESAVDASAVVTSAAESARHARAGDHAAALAHAEEGLALFDGPPDASGDDPLALLRADRARTYRDLVRSRALALARLGRRDEAVGPLAGLAAEHPHDEEILTELLRCEAATAGPSAALARFESYRRSLRDELGTDPGPALRAVHQELLRETVPDGAPAVRRGIAHEPNPLLGRAGDLANVLGLLRTSRVTSIVGPGGLGKTRLAHAVARRAEQRIVHVVPLAGVAPDGDVAGEVASVLGVGEARGAHGRMSVSADLAAGIADALGPALLVLDNCEHVVSRAADLVGALVSMSRDLRVLTTGRAPLGLSSESVYPLPELDEATAAELFEQRARAARPTADLPAAHVRELCRHLDGLPLAVELAAARVRIMSVAEIARRLDDRFALLRGGARDAPARHRTMHAVVDWSWNLLAPRSRAAMRALSVFPGGFTAGAARHLVGDDVLDILEDLADQSLLVVADTGAGARFRMLESVREFAAAHREEAGDTDRAVTGLLAWAHEFGTAHHERLFEAEPLDTVELVRAEQDNLQQALRYGLARRDGPPVAAVAAVLGALWTIESAFTRLSALAGEASGVLTMFRPGPEDVATTRAALALCSMISLVLKGPQMTRTLVALRRLPPPSPSTLGGAMELVVRAAPEILAEGSSALDELRASDEPLVAGIADVVAGYVLERAGDLRGALAATEAALKAAEAPVTPWVGVAAHSRLSELLMQVDESERALAHLKAALRLLERYRWRDMFGLHWAIAGVNLHLGEYDEAERWADRSLVSGPEESYGTATFDLGGRAEMALGRGDTGTGLRLWREAVDRLKRDADPSIEPAFDPWTLESHIAAVVAHARHGRLDLVEDVVAGLPAKLSALLADPPPPIPAFFMDLPVQGGILVALAMVDLARGGDPARAARMIALAERLNFVRMFQPTMAPDAVRRAARDADGPAYADAVSGYAGLDRDGLRAAARAALDAWVTATDRG